VFPGISGTSCRIHHTIPEHRLRSSGSADSTVPRYVAAALLGTGATGIIQGVEFGEKERIRFIGREKKMTYPAVPRFAQFINQVNAILTDYPAFRRGKTAVR